MNRQHFDIVGIGNAVVDIISLADDNVLELLGLVKGSMVLVDEQKTEFLYNYISCIKEDFLTPPKEMSGGCAANTVAGISSFGGSAAFIGKVNDDYFGERFVKKLRARGVHFSTEHIQGTPGTGRSLIIVSQDDASRTMCTFLGASMKLTPEDVDETLISCADTIFMEAFLLDCQHGSAVIRKAINSAKKYGKKIAFSLSDSLCVNRHYDEILELVDNHIDILFGNKREVNAFCSTHHHDEALQQLLTKCNQRQMIAACTCAGDGVHIVSQDGIKHIPASSSDNIVDTTGCGDLFASGFLYGYLRGYNLEQSARLGCMAGAEILRQLGARPKTDLSELLQYFDPAASPQKRASND